MKNLCANGDISTLTGFSMYEVLEKMQELLEPEAYTKIAGGVGEKANLTDISPAYLIEALSECFGPCGLGWWYEYDPESIKVDKMDKAFKATVKDFRLFFRLIFAEEAMQDVHPIPSTGGSINMDISYAVNGAITNALGNAAWKLCWQLDVRKGKISHANAKELWEKREVGERPYPPETIKDRFEKRVAYHEKKGSKVTKNMRGVMSGVMNRVFASPTADNDRITALHFLCKKPNGEGILSSSEMSAAQIMAASDWLAWKEDTGGQIIADPTAAIELKNLVDWLIRKGEYIEREKEAA